MLPTSSSIPGARGGDDTAADEMPPVATHGLLQFMPSVWSTPMGAERHVQPDDEPKGVERLATDHEGTCLTLRSRLLS